MGWKLKTSVKVVNTCPTCKREYTNRFTHVCVVGMAELGAPAGMRKARAAKRQAAKENSWW